MARVKEPAMRCEERDDEREGSLAFEVTKPINAVEADHMLSHEMNWRRHSGLVIEGDLNNASPENPVIVWVLRGEGEEVTYAFKRVVDQVGPPPVRGGQARALTEAEARVRTKAVKGEMLEPDEVQEALRVLLLRRR